MKLPENTNRTGLSSIGLAGCIVLAGIVFGAISPWWLILSALMIIMGVGLESGQSKNNLQ